MRALFVTIVSAVIAGGGGTYAWLYYGGFGGERGTVVAFVNAYGTYAGIAQDVETLVHVPGIEANTDREELLALLNAMLTESMDAAKRESLARIAFTHLDTLKREIDAAQAAQARLYATLQDFDNAGRAFTGMRRAREASSLVARARERAELSARITALLAESNDHTYAIVTRILADMGELTDEHVRTINGATDVAQERFDTTAQLYSNLARVRGELEQAFAAFVASAL